MDSDFAGGLGRLHDAGALLTGRRLRTLINRLTTISFPGALDRRILRMLIRTVLRPFPGFSMHLCQLATVPGTIRTRSASLPSFPDPSLLVNSFYRAAFGRAADPPGLAGCVEQLRSGVSPESLADRLVGSAEFQARHGPGQNLDLKYLTALYRDALGRQADPGNLAFWLTEGNNGATRARVLAALAGSDEALERSLPSKPDRGTAYDRWIAANDTISNADRAAIRAHIAALPFCPVISVIAFAGETSVEAFRKSIDSILTQLYTHWELRVVVDAGPESASISHLRRWRAHNPRIRMVQTGTVEDRVAALNAALALPAGEFVVFLRAGDILTEQALYEAAIEFAGNPGPDIVYSDHDQINSAGRRFNPWFKPGWDPDLLLAQDYVSQFAAYRRTLLEEIGFLRPGFGGAEFYDLALRATAVTTADRIRHVPVILCHRHCEDGTTGSGLDATDARAVAAATRAVRDCLDRRGDTEAFLEPVPQLPGALRVVWPVPTPEPLVSVIIPTRDRADLLARCAEGVLRQTDYSNLELLIVDNGSIEPATFALFDRLIDEDGRVRILNHPAPFNYSALNNAAARKANGEVLLFLNNDTRVSGSGWLREMVSRALRPAVGVVGAKLLYMDGRMQHGGIILGPEGAVVHVHRGVSRDDPGYFGQLALARTLSAVTGACVAIRRSVFFEVGGFDEVNLSVTFNDIDLCLRTADYGYRVVWTPFAELFHLECASRGQDDTPAKRARFLREWQHMRKTWGSLLTSADPFHNPNLLFASDQFRVPSTPRRPKPWFQRGGQGFSSPIRSEPTEWPAG